MDSGNVHGDEEKRIVSLAQLADQASNLEMESSCVHHWIVDEAGSAHEGGYAGQCKWCGTETVFPSDPKIDLAKRTGVMRKHRAVYEDWLERLQEAESMAGVAHSVDREAA